LDTSVRNETELLREITKLTTQIGLTLSCPGSGPLESKILVIGEAPGEKEEQMKIPLVGPSGAYFWDKMQEIGITRSQCYVTNVCKRVLNFGRQMSDKSPIKKDERDHWEGLLDWEIDQLPNIEIVIILGGMALHALVNDSKITNWRGSVFNCMVGRSQRKVSAIAMFNPAYILYESRWEVIYKFDANKIKLVREGKYKKHVIKHRINLSLEEAHDELDSLMDTDKPIAFDIETIANQTACIGFANQAHEGVCINFRGNTSDTFSLEDEVGLRKHIQRLFSKPGKRFIAQNGNFDAYWLWYKDRIRVQPIWFDTLLAHHTLYPRMPHNLGFLTAQYTTHPYYKDEGKEWRENPDPNAINQFWDYNVKDCAITYAVHEKLHEELKEQKLDKFFFDRVMKLQPHLTAMTVGGIKADEEYKDKLAIEFQEELDKKIQQFYSIAEKINGEPLYPNLRSNQQMAKFWFDDMKLVGHGRSTNKANRDRMLVHPGTTDTHAELIHLYNDFATDTKFLSTYLNSKVDPDGRIRCEYRQWGVQSAPGRLSSAQVMWGSGMNLQNQPEKAYHMFVSDPGYMFTYFDLSQAEARIVAYQWKVNGLIESFERAKTDNSFDVHRGNAERIFRIPYDEIPSYDRDDKGRPTLRFLGKRCVHGLNYRMGAPLLAEVCGIPINQAFEAHAAYHLAFPEIRKAWKEIADEVRANKVLYSLLGRRLIILERITEKLLEPIVAFVPQSTIGDKVAGCIYECHEDPEWPIDARMLLNIHDALIAIHKPEDKEIVQRIMKKHAESPIKIRGQDIIIPAEIKESHPGEDGLHRWSTIN